MPENQYLSAGQAVLHHHFDCHDYCAAAWCYRKRLTAAERLLPQNKRFYRSMTKDVVLFEKLQPMVERFVTIDRLKEVAHGMDTQVNESFNNTFSWLAPKNKVYCGSQSLRNRLSIGIGINALGHPSYFTRLYKTLGIVMTENVQNFLDMKESRRTKRIQKVKLIESKKQRRRLKFDKQKRDEATATKERDKRDGTYKTAQNMEDIVEDDPAATGEGGTSTTATNKKIAARVCRHCGKKGHTTTRSKHCSLHPSNVARQAGVPTGAAAAAPPTAAELNDIASAFDSEVEEMDDLYCKPITDDTPSDEDVSISQFQDCGTWSDNEDDFTTGVL
jgi:hypothetical protein